MQETQLSETNYGDDRANLLPDITITLRRKQIVSFTHSFQLNISPSPCDFLFMFVDVVAGVFFFGVFTLIY